jgi:hypothetical protein
VAKTLKNKDNIKASEHARAQQQLSAGAIVNVLFVRYQT